MKVVVHRIGARHLIDPERLLTSARRIYGDRMEALWGDFLPVPGGLPVRFLVKSHNGETH